MRAGDVTVGTQVEGLGFVVAITDSMYQQKDGTVVRCPGTLDLYFRTRPLSPRGKIRGTDNGKLTIGTDDLIMTAGEC